VAARPQRDFSEPLQRQHPPHTRDGNPPGVRALTGFLVVLAVVTLLTQQYWLLPAGLVIVVAGLVLTSR
jgi:hypothetical protein